MRKRGRGLGMVTVFLVAACGDGDEDANVCAAVESCGGDVVGTWQIESMCADQSSLGENFEIPFPEECAGSFRDGDLEPAGLTFDFSADGNWTFAGAVSARISYALDQTCLTALNPLAPPVNADFCQVLAGTTQDGLRTEAPEATVTCALESDSCACETAYTYSVSAMSPYSTVGNELRSNGALVPYCVSGDTLDIQEAEFGTLSGRRN